jgi:hypothetical protein
MKLPAMKVGSTTHGHTKDKGAKQQTPTDRGDGTKDFSGVEAQQRQGHCGGHRHEQHLAGDAGCLTSQNEVSPAGGEAESAGLKDEAKANADEDQKACLQPRQEDHHQHTNKAQQHQAGFSQSGHG